MVGDKQVTFFKPKKDNAHEIFQYGFTSGKDVERERIIKLLQERWSLTDDVVALIREENK
jgi:hypothetical protein